MTKPYELMEAELVYGMCQTYHCLPEKGALLDQPVWLLRMQTILKEGGYFKRGEATGASVPKAERDPFADIPMLAIA